MNQLEAECLRIMADIDWSPLWMTIKTAAVSVLILFIPALWAARAVTGKKIKAKRFIDAIMLIPMLLPPTATGFLLLMLFGSLESCMNFIPKDFGISFIRSWAGCVAAAVVVSLPVMYRLTRNALEHVDKDTVEAASTLGIKKSVIFRKVVLPQARPGIIAGFIVSFARAAGEYGATSILAGNTADSPVTVSIVIAQMIQNGDYAKAWIWVIVMLLIAFAVLFVLNTLADVRTSKRSGRKAADNES